MNASDFKPGDVVYLRIGSYPMAVEAVVGDDIALAWMTPDGVMQRTAVPPEVLMRETPELAHARMRYANRMGARWAADGPEVMNGSDVLRALRLRRETSAKDWMT